MASNKIIGIDLGTTNSCLAILEAGGKTRVIENGEGQLFEFICVWFYFICTDSKPPGVAGVL